MFVSISIICISSVKSIEGTRFFLMPSFKFICFKILRILWEIKGNFSLYDYFNRKQASSITLWNELEQWQNLLLPLHSRCWQVKGILLLLHINESTCAVNESSCSMNLLLQITEGNKITGQLYSFDLFLFPFIFLFLFFLVLPPVFSWQCLRSFITFSFYSHTCLCFLVVFLPLEC